MAEKLGVPTTGEGESLTMTLTPCADIVLGVPTTGEGGFRSPWARGQGCIQRCRKEWL